MKTLMLSINSKYIHTLLANRYFKSNASDLDIEILETNINVNINNTLQSIYLTHPDIITISCYIFNIEYVNKLLNEIKLLLPNVIVIVGGYEVEYNIDYYINKVDFIIRGEGDFAVGNLIRSIEKGDNDLPQIINADTICNLDDIKSPYTDDYCKLGSDKILYFESSRGCPFHCAYCMSSNSNGVRTFSLERTFSDLRYIMTFNPKQIKFVDRTFNFDMHRASLIMNFIVDNFSNSNTNFHFEMAPELFSEEMFEVIKKAKKGLFQFELGVQSYNPKTLKAVCRYEDANKMEDNIKELISFKNANIHVDLIAGLPYENLECFIDGFNRLFKLKSDDLQLGFLKILKGSKMAEQQDGYVVHKMPPYEVISSPELSYDEILQLKNAEEMLEMFYNSGKFKLSIDYIVSTYYKPYDFFFDLSKYYYSMYNKNENVAPFHLCDVIFNFSIKYVFNNKEDIDKLESLINQDYKNLGSIRQWHHKY